MSEKDFKKKEIKFELKLVALFSIDDFNELKEKVINMIRNKLSYNFDYIKNKVDREGSFTFRPCNFRCYCKGKFSEYKEINQEQKDFMNGEIAAIRKSHLDAQSISEIEIFTKEQKEKIDDIYYKMEKEIYDIFNSSKVIIESCYFERKIAKKGDKK